MQQAYASPSAPPERDDQPDREPKQHCEFELALLESRQRWREVVGLSADFVFETDAAGCLSFVWPDRVLGWAASGLLGRRPEMLLSDAGGPSVCNPFRPSAPMRKRRAWLKRADGGATCLMFASAPMLDDQGRITGARGMAQDVTEQDGYDAAVAAALRRGEVIDHILWRMREEIMAPRMMHAVLDSLCSALGAEGAAVIGVPGGGAPANAVPASETAVDAGAAPHAQPHAEPHGEPHGADLLCLDPVPRVPHQHGTGGAAVSATVRACLENDAADPACVTSPDGRLVLVCPSQTRFGERSALALWRPPGGRAWDTEETVLAASATGIVRVILEHDNIQREMARQARTDPLTGLLNRRAFFDEMARRFERLDRDDIPGTLMFVDLDHFKALNDACGHEAGDDALKAAADVLRSACRAADLVARLGGDEFAIWLDGADDLAAAERAEALRLQVPEWMCGIGEAQGISLTMSIGIATRWPGRGDSIEALVGRADRAMYEVKRAGRGHWRVHRGEP